MDSLPPSNFSKPPAQHYNVGAQETNYYSSNTFPGIQTEPPFTPQTTDAISRTNQIEVSFVPYDPYKLTVLGIEHGITEQQVEDINKIRTILPDTIFPIIINEFEEGPHLCTAFMAAINPRATYELTAAHCFSPFTDASDSQVEIANTAIYLGMQRALTTNEASLSVGFTNWSDIIVNRGPYTSILALTDSAIIRTTGSRLQSTGHVPDFPLYTYETLVRTLNEPTNRFYAVGYPGENINERGELEPVLIPLVPTGEVYLAKGLGFWFVARSIPPIGDIPLQGMSGGPILDLNDEGINALSKFSSYWIGDDGHAYIYAFTPYFSDGIPPS